MNNSRLCTACRSFTSMTLLALMIMLVPSHASGQEPVTLISGKKVERDIAGVEKHQYKLQLGANSFFFAVAQQEGVDIILRLVSPGGRKLREFDSPNGTRGPEYVLATTDSAGDYLLEVTPLGEGGSGHYTLMLNRIEPSGTDAATRADQLMSPWKGKESPGASIGVVMDGKLVFARGYGMADLESGLPNTPQTIFHMASVSKQFTAMAILMLADQKKLSLDDSIQQYLPEMPDFGRTITIRHLIHHTSGLRDQWNLWALGGGRLDDVITQDELYRLVTRQRELNFTPGSEHFYCNTGYMLLAKIVERASGVPFRVWMQQNVFAPLGMAHTQIYDDHQRIVRGRAYSFEADSAGFHKSVLSYANSGATSLFSTVEDLAPWLGNFWDPRVGGERVLQMMQQRGVLTKGDTLSYACGIVIDRYHGLLRFSHSGGDAGYRTYIASFPEIHGGVIVLSNLGSFNP
ncbi:class A beta-lactamase-related serine hydrolase, partial [bacterium]